MEFGSKYVYTYSDSEEEEVSEEEYEGEYTACVPEGFRARSGVSDALDTVPTDASEDNDRSKDSASVSSATAKSPKSIGASIKRKSSKKCASQPPQKVHHWMSLTSKPASKSEGIVKPEPVADPEDVGGSSSAQPLKPRGRLSKKWRRADTNVVAINFDRLTSPSNMHTGDPIMCTGCQAMLSHISKLTKEADIDLWICEFCGVSNTVDLVAEEMPTQSDVTYMVEPAPVTTASGRSGIDESLVVFCVDISGSMCVSQEVPGNMRLKGNHADRFRSLNTENEDQWLRGQRHDVTYVTRLQGLQAAVDNQLQELSKDHPNRRIALVTFNSEVTIVGDGSGIPMTVAGDKLSNMEELMKVGSEVNLPTSIATSRDTLGKKIFELEEGGQTALGPALLVSVMMACEVPGSKVIICTDGMANVGLGNLDNLCTTEEFDTAAAFYQKVSEVAKGKGVSVSVLTIAGTECKLVELGRVASQTGGQVNTVDPMKLTQEFGNILADPIIATRVVATFIVHKGLYIRHEAEKSSRSVMEVGNVAKGTEITFEYGTRRMGLKHDATKEMKKLKKTKDRDEEATAGSSRASAAKQNLPQRPPCAPVPPPVNDSEELPFQVQISYVDLEGARAVRVLTQTKPITKEREQAEKYMNMSILSAHALQQSSALAIEGDYAPSRLNSYMYQRMFYRNVVDTPSLNQYSVYNSRSAPLSDGLLAHQRRESIGSGRTVMQLDEEYEGAEEEAAKGTGAVRKRDSRGLFKGQSKVRAERRKSCSDAVAQKAYINRKSCSGDLDRESSQLHTLEPLKKKHHNSREAGKSGNATR